MSKNSLLEIEDQVQCPRCRMIQPIVTQIDLSFELANVDVKKFIRDERELSKRIAAQHHATQCNAEQNKRGPILITGVK